MKHSTDNTIKTAKELDLSYYEYSKMLRAVEKDISLNVTQAKNVKIEDVEKKTNQEQPQSVMQMARNARVIK